MATDSQLIQALFFQVIELPPEQRGAAIDEACADRPEVRERIEQLLAAHEEDDSLLDRSKGPLERALLSEPTDEDHRAKRAGETIGDRFILRRRIGEGGMGEVWVAEQSQPVRREVAVKLIKSGMDSKSVLTRFEQERQALAVMDHPNIAKVLDGGVSEAGEPYFVMELVHGAPLDRFCDEAKLSLAERLELFQPICRAVQHAHHKGIVHRDLKPSNILVTVVDGKPIPKVIDFGVAKATGGRLTDQSLATQFGMVVGTLEYMAPEQAGVSGVDIDTRADIYSLGVILYELLTGLRPYDGARLRNAAIAEMIRIICDEEPSRPSTRLSTADSRQSLAAVRSTEPKRLSAELRGELDWVVMKCLEKDRSRRYDSATGLLRDIERFLSDEPVEARPPSTGYRLSKFLRRNKWTATAAAAVLVSLLVGVAGTSWGLVEARHQAAQAELARQAESKRAEGELAAKQQAEGRLAQVEQANNILGSIFDNLKPEEIARQERPLQAILVDHLDAAVEQLDGNAIGDPLVVANMQVRLGGSLMRLGAPAKGRIPMEKALATFRRIYGPNHGQTLTTQNDFGLALHEAGDRAAALPLLKEAHQLALRHQADDHTLVALLANNLANVYLDSNTPELALPLYEGLREDFRARGDEQNPYLLEILPNLGTGYLKVGRIDDAVKLLRETYKLTQKTFAEGHPANVSAMHRLAQALQQAGKFQEAIPLYETAYRLRRETLGDRHVATIIALIDWGHTLLQSGQPKQAVPLLENAMQLAKQRNDPARIESAAARLVLAYQATDQLEKSLQALELLQQRLTKKHGSDAPQVQDVNSEIQFIRNLATAESRYKESLASDGRDHMNTLLARRDLAQRYIRTGQLDQAEVALIEILGKLPRDANDGIFIFTLTLLARCYEQRKANAPDSWLTFDRQSVLGGFILSVGDTKTSGPLLEQGYAGLAQREDQVPADKRDSLTAAIQRLVEYYERVGDAEQASQFKAKLKSRQGPSATDD